MPPSTNEMGQPTVTDVSLVGRWDAREESSTADVMIYAKVTPHPSTKISLLHLQPLVLQTTLVRVVPLLPDGTSPWESPGVEALNIATVAGRKPRKIRTGLSLRKVRDVLTDGAVNACNTIDDGSAVGRSASPSSVTTTTRHNRDIGIASENSFQGAPSTVFDGSYDDHDEQEGVSVPDPDYLPSINFSVATSCQGSPNSEYTPHQRSLLDELDSSLCGGVKLGEDGMQDDTQEDFSPCLGPEYSWLPGSPASLELGISPFELVGKRCISYRRASDGIMQKTTLDPEDWDEAIQCAQQLEVNDLPTKSRRDSNCVFTPMVDRKGRIFSSGSYQSIRGTSPLPKDMFDHLKLGSHDHSDDPAVLRKFLPHGHDGAGEFKEKYKGKLRSAKHVLIPEDRHEESTPGERHITISVEDNALFLCFPPHIRTDPVVVEILLKVRPLILGSDKQHHTFIFSGLPYCENPAFFDFKVNSDDEEWVFAAGEHEQTAAFEPLALDEPNRLRGQLYLKDQTATERSIIMRIQRVPSHVEIYDYKIRTKTSALFFWTPDGKVAAEFEIEVYFIDVDVVDKVSRNLVNLIFVNGTDNPKDITITTSAGNHEKFSLEGPILKNGQELKSAALLQISRLVRDVRDPLTISFRKVQDCLPTYFHIPLVELGNPLNMLEQVVVIHEPFLPLNLSFTPDLAFWKQLNEEDGLPGSRKITRIDMEEIEYPRVYINSLEPVSSTAVEILSKSKHLDFIDILRFEAEEHSPALWKPRNPMPLHLRMSFELQAPRDEGEELLRVNQGYFQPEFVTINGIPAKMLFMDEDDLVVLNYGQVYRGETMKINAYWSAMQPITISTVGGGKMLELQLPRVLGCLVGRVVFKYQKENSQITSRAHNLNAPVLESGPWSVPLTNGRATLSGLQTFSNRLYLHAPLAPSQWPPKSQAGSIVEDGASLTEGVVFAYDEPSSVDGPSPSLPVQSFHAQLDGTFSTPPTIRTAISPTQESDWQTEDEGDEPLVAPSSFQARLGWISTIASFMIPTLWLISFILVYAMSQSMSPYSRGPLHTGNSFEVMLMEAYADVLHSTQNPLGPIQTDETRYTTIFSAADESGAEPIIYNTAFWESLVDGTGDESDDVYHYTFDKLATRTFPRQPWTEEIYGRVMIFQETFMGLLFERVQKRIQEALDGLARIVLNVVGARH
ncbi:hypothetical protein FN846DRAFT_1019833 [Sphaerosporella brunnea]|uniref:Uncharacterized protein n=1 Tax=Sphaerosporella brunnea TaxID=1250544 RepID=A0A5J5F492_9PEZI|nr:hypothetical protein FN846DRAFT_1019833 [Sphaerosporella brunnea]